MSILRGKEASGTTDGLALNVLKMGQANNNSTMFPVCPSIKSDVFPFLPITDCDTTYSIRKRALEQLKKSMEEEISKHVFDFGTNREIHKLDKLLTEKGIPHSFGPHPFLSL